MYDSKGFARRLDVVLRMRQIGKMYALAMALGIDESALSRWRRGKPISVGNLVRLARYLRVSIDWLLTGTGSMELPEQGAGTAWQSEILADLSSLEPTVRVRLADLMRHLAEARRIGSYDPAAWNADARLSTARGVDGPAVEA